MPTYLLEFSRDDLSDTTPTWIDITPYFLEGSYRHGHGVLGDPEAGTASLVLVARGQEVRFEGNAVAGFNARGEIPVGRDAIERPTDCDEIGRGR
jgi:hypothetical protein